MEFTTRAAQTAAETTAHLRRILAQSGITKTGGYFAICDDMPSAQLSLMIRIGTIPREKYPKLSLVLSNDMQQLIRHPDQIASFDIREPLAWATTSDPNGKGAHPQEVTPWGVWGGTFRIKNRLYGAQGWTEAGSEALVIVTAVALGELFRTDALIDIVSQRNKYLHLLLGAMQL